MSGRNGKAKPVRGPEAPSGFPDPFESGVLFDERMLDREHTLARYFTPFPGREGIHPTREKLYDTPDGTYALLNPRSTFVAPQIRELYDPTRIDRMGISIRDTEDGQLQNGGVSFIDDDHIEQYLADMNEYFGTEIKLENLTKHPTYGCYIVTAYGHNRQFAIASANLQTNGHPDKGKRLHVKVFKNPEFWRILGNQATENTGEPPPMWVRARQIVKYQAFRNRDGVQVTKEDVGKLFNVDKDQIWRAERYDALPQPIKDLVMAEKLPYSGAFELDLLNGIYDQAYIIDLAIRLADNRASVSQILDAVRRRIAVSELTAEIRSIVDQGQITHLQGVELAKLRPYATDEGLNQFAVWICTARPEIDEIRTRVRNMIKEAVSGVMQLYSDDSTAMPNLDDMAAAMAKSRRDEMAEGIRRLVREINRSLEGAKALITSGLAGDLVAERPIANGSPEYMQQLVGSLVDELNRSGKSGQSSEIVSRLEALQGINTEDSGLVTLLDSVLVELEQLLELESGETPQTQAARRETVAAGIIALIREPQPVQEGLFQ